MFLKGNKMVFRENSFVVRALLVITNPVPWLPSLLPMRMEQCRVGNNTTDFVRVSFFK
jgi:hypothetical protein